MRPLTYGVLGAGIAVVVGCGGGGGDGGGTTQPPPTVASVTVSPPAPDTLFGIGQTLALTATARNAAGSPVSGATITFASQNQTVASVTNAGVVSAVGAGSTTVTASAANVNSDPVPIRVRQKFTALVLGPTATTVTVGGTLQFSASPRDAAGTAIAGLPAPSFTSSAPAVGTIDATTGAFSAVAAGLTTVTASLTSPEDGVRTATRDITVTDPPQANASIVTGPGNAFTPPSVTIPSGGAVAFTVGAPHNVLFENTNIQDLDFGVSGTRTFGTPGTYRFRCQAHSTNFTTGMIGTVVVQ